MNSKEIYLCDTTLRDGEQSCGFAFPPNIKIRLARLLDDAGVYQIEAGIPAMGNCEKDAICGIMDVRKKARIAVWSRMRKEDIVNAFDCRPDIIHISAPVSDIMIKTMLHKDRSWVVQTLKDCVAQAREKGYEVSVGFQDASRSDMAFMIRLARMVSRLGAQILRLADTVGILTPLRCREMMKMLSEETDMALGIHTHNDLGMADAVALEAVRGGAVLVDATLFGIGERAGNCHLQRFAAGASQCFDIKPDREQLARLDAESMRLLLAQHGMSRWMQQ